MSVRLNCHVFRMNLTEAFLKDLKNLTGLVEDAQKKGENRFVLEAFSRYTFQCPQIGLRSITVK